MNLDKLNDIIKDRKTNPKKDSYVSNLFKEGPDRIIQKVGEEATEVVIAAKNNDKKRLIEEIADLWFHSLVLLNEKSLSPEIIFEELEKRNNKPKLSSKG